MTLRQPIRRWALLAVLACCGGPALAQYSCNINTGSLASAGNYDPFSATPNDTTGLLTLNNCTRARGGGNRFPATFWLGADNGRNFAGSRRMRNGTTGNYLTYFLGSGNCTTAWGATNATGYTFANGNTGPNDVVTLPDPLSPGAPFCLRINAGQTTAVPSSLLTVPPGLYSDIVRLTLRSANSGGFQWAFVDVTLSTRVDPACQFTTPPANIELNYTSFSTAAVSASSDFQVRCTNTTSYNLSVEPNTGLSLLGLNYGVGVSSPAGAGTGATQLFSVTANIPANQSGTCSAPPCTATQNHSVKLTY